MWNEIGGSKHIRLDRNRTKAFVNAPRPTSPYFCGSSTVIRLSRYGLGDRRICVADNDEWQTNSIFTLNLDWTESDDKQLVLASALLFPHGVRVRVYFTSLESVHGAGCWVRVVLTLWFHVWWEVRCNELLPAIYWRAGPALFIPTR